jgi:hypothetical protein
MSDIEDPNLKFIYQFYQWSKFIDRMMSVFLELDDANCETCLVCGVATLLKMANPATTTPICMNNGFLLQVPMIFYKLNKLGALFSCKLE